MALKKTNKDAEKHEYEVKVLRAKELKASGKVSTNVGFDMEVNGIKIYGCYYKEGKKDDGKQWSLITLPQTKANDGEYYSIVWFPINKELTEEIVDQIGKLL